MAFGAGGGRRRQRFSAFMATFFPVSLLGFSNWEEKRRAGLWSPAAAVSEAAAEAGARRSGPGLAGRRLWGTRGRGARAGPAGRPETLSRRGAGERAGCLGVGDGCLRHGDRQSPLGRGRAAPGMATSRQTASRRTRMEYIYSGEVAWCTLGNAVFSLHPGPVTSASPRTVESLQDDGICSPVFSMSTLIVLHYIIIIIYTTTYNPPRHWDTCVIPLLFH